MTFLDTEPVPVVVNLPRRLDTAVPYADVLVDLRHDQSPPLPLPPEREHTIRKGGAVVSATMDRTTNTVLLHWKDPDGFRGAIVGSSVRENRQLQHADGTPAGPFQRMQDIFPHAAHLMTSSAVTIRSVGPQRVLTTHLPSLSALLQDPDQMFAPITLRPPLSRDGVTLMKDPDTQVAYRLAWAALGCTIDRVPSVLRNTSLIEDPLEWGQMPSRALPYGLLYTHPRHPDWMGVRVGAHWMAEGFDLDDIEYWAHVATTYSPETRDGHLIVQPERIRAVAAFKDHGFTPVEAAQWVLATTPTARPKARLHAEVLAAFRDRGLDRNVLAWLVADAPPGNERDMVRHVNTWLAVAGQDRAGWYVAAGISLAEATSLEVSGEAPSVDSLRMLAGLRSAEQSDEGVLPDPSVFPLS